MHRYNRKTPKSQQIDKNAYTCYNPHNVSLDHRKWSDIIRIISIDPGIRNFAIRVEERNIKNPGPITTLLYEKFRIKNEDRELTELSESKLYKKLTDFLDMYIDLFQTCHIVIIERQMPFNYKATRIAQHTLTYFMMLLRNNRILPLFFEIDSKLKGKQLGASSHLNERGIKAWSVDKAIELLNYRNDKIAIDIMAKNKNKADDLADTVCQIEALFSYLGLPLTVIE